MGYIISENKTYISMVNKNIDSLILKLWIQEKEQEINQ